MARPLAALSAALLGGCSLMLDFDKVGNPGPGGDCVSGLALRVEVKSGQDWQQVERTECDSCSGCATALPGVALGSRVRLTFEAARGTRAYLKDWALDGLAGCEVTEAFNSCTFNLSTATTARAVFGFANYAFLTSDIFSGSELGDADALCASAASDASLPGSYRALVAKGGADPRSKWRDRRGWIGTDGKPFLDELTPASDAYPAVLYPLTLDEAAAEATDRGVYTGTLGNGAPDPGYDCLGWTDATADHLAFEGFPGVGSDWWINFREVSCDARLRVFCLGADLDEPVRPAQGRGKLAFVKPGFTVAGGLTAADAFCSQGQSRPFRALLTTSAQAAVNRLSISAEYVRADGVLLGSGKAIADRGWFLAPLEVAADGSHQTGERSWAWTGGLDATSLGSAAVTCSDWTDGTSSASGIYDWVARSAIEFGLSTSGCDYTDGGLYCVEE